MSLRRATGKDWFMDPVTLRLSCPREEENWPGQCDCFMLVHRGALGQWLWHSEGGRHESGTPRCTLNVTITEHLLWRNLGLTREFGDIPLRYAHGMEAVWGWTSGTKWCFHHREWGTHVKVCTCRLESPLAPRLQRLPDCYALPPFPYHPFLSLLRLHTLVDISHFLLNHSFYTWLARRHSNVLLMEQEMHLEMIFYSSTVCSQMMWSPTFFH